MLLIWSIAKANEIDNQEPMPIIPHDCRIDRTENELWMFSEMNFRGGMDSDSEHHPHTIRIFSRTVHIQSICCWVWWLQTQYWRTIYRRVINKSKMWWGHRFFLTFSLLIVNDQQFFFSLSLSLRQWFVGNRSWSQPKLNGIWWLFLLNFYWEKNTILNQFYGFVLFNFITNFISFLLFTLFLTKLSLTLSLDSIRFDSITLFFF